ncbi:MAG: hypothetical protein JNM50_00515 [Chromatiales bacterium]|nr:hypothetical protein [Chromatiales bacterium]
MNSFRAAAWAAAVVVVAGCGGGGGGGSGDAFTITLQSATAVLEGSQGGVVPTASLLATANRDYAGNLFVAAILDGPGLDPVIPVIITGRQATIQLQALPGLAAGTYSGRLQLLACADVGCTQKIGGTPLDVNYTVRITGFSVTPPPSLEITPDTAAPALAGSVNVAAVLPGGGSAGTWTASESSPWLVLAAASGPFGSPLGFQVDPAALAALPDNAEAEASIALSSPGLAPVNVPIRLRKRLGTVSGLGPYVLVAGQPAELWVRGAGYSATTSPQARLLIPGVTPGAVTTVSDTALRVSLPPLAAGEYTVAFTNALALTTPSRRLVVIDPRTYDAAAIPNGVILDGLVADHERGQFFSAARAAGQIVRFRRVAGAWQRDTLSVSGLVDVGLAADGSRLVVTTTTGILVLDPVTLADAGSSPNAAFATQTIGTEGVPVTNDGRAWFSVGLRSLATYDVGSGALTVDANQRSYQDGPWFGMSRNGERLVISQQACCTPAAPLLYLNASDGVFRQAPGEGGFFVNAHLSDDGQRALINQIDVRGPSFQSLGLLPATAGFQAVAGAVSPDGDRCYTLSYPDSAFGLPASPDLPKVFVYDCAGAGVPPLLGSFGVPAYPGCWELTGPSCNSVRPVRAIAADGGTLFFAGNRNFLVVPIPAALDPI